MFGHIKYNTKKKNFKSAVQAALAFREILLCSRAIYNSLNRVANNK